jgi:hypothetical protein
VQITAQDTTVGVRQPTVSKNTSLGREFFRSATWEEGDTTITVTVVAFVTGLRARKNPDGSVSLTEQVSRFAVLREGEFVQPVEVALFFWEREKMAEDGHTVYDAAVDHCPELGIWYQPTVEQAEEQCRIFMENLDFESHCDPDAWA